MGGDCLFVGACVIFFFFGGGDCLCVWVGGGGGGGAYGGLCLVWGSHVSYHHAPLHTTQTVHQVLLDGKDLKDLNVHWLRSQVRPHV